jgi:hypothetical protein
MRSLQRGAVGALLVATALAAAACGGGGSAAGTASTTATTSTTSTSAGAAGGANGAAFAKYTACLEQNGVTLPTFGGGRPPGGAGGNGQGNAPTGTAPAPPTGTNAAGGQGRPRFATSAKFRKAAAACAKLRPTGFGGGGGFGGFGGRGGQASAAFAAYRNCLKLHGVTLTGFGRGGNGGAAPTAKQQKALTACASLRPARGARPGSSTPTSTTQ